MMMGAGSFAQLRDAKRRQRQQQQQPIRLTARQTTTRTEDDCDEQKLAAYLGFTSVGRWTELRSAAPQSTSGPRDEQHHHHQQEQPPPPRDTLTPPPPQHTPTFAGRPTRAPACNRPPIFISTLPSSARLRPPPLVAFLLLVALLAGTNLIIQESRCNPKPGSFLDGGKPVPCPRGKQVDIDDYIPTTAALKRCFSCSCPDGNVVCDRVALADCMLPPAGSKLAPTKSRNRAPASELSLPGASASGRRHPHAHVHTFHDQIGGTEVRAPLPTRAPQPVARVPGQKQRAGVKQKQQTIGSAPVAQPIGGGGGSKQTKGIGGLLRKSEHADEEEPRDLRGADDDEILKATTANWQRGLSKFRRPPPRLDEQHKTHNSAPDDPRHLSEFESDDFLKLAYQQRDRNLLKLAATTTTTTPPTTTTIEPEDEPETEEPFSPAIIETDDNLQPPAMSTQPPTSTLPPTTTLQPQVDLVNERPLDNFDQHNKNLNSNDLSAPDSAHEFAIGQNELITAPDQSSSRDLMEQITVDGISVIALIVLLVIVLLLAIIIYLARESPKGAGRHRDDDSEDNGSDCNLSDTTTSTTSNSCLKDIILCQHHHQRSSQARAGYPMQSREPSPLMEKIQIK